MGKSFFNGTEAELYTGSQHYFELIHVQPLVYGLTTGLASQYEIAKNSYATAYLAAINPDTRTKGKIAAKNLAKKALRALSSDLAKIIDGTPSVTDEQKIDLGLSVRKTPAPKPAPTDSPDIDILSTSGRTVKIRVHSAATTGRARPEGVDGASVWTYVGATPPADTSAWKFQTNTNKTTLDITFDASVPNGATVWFTAFWIGSRLESGPASQPVSANIPGGAAMAA